MKKLIITEEERSRILGMHQSAIKKEFLMEQDSKEWAAYNTSSNTAKTGYKITDMNDVTPEEAKNGTYGVQFYVQSLETGIKNPNTYYYQCIDSANLKAGQVYDADDKPKPIIIQQLEASKLNYRAVFNEACKAAYPYKKATPQVAGAQTKTAGAQTKVASKPIEYQGNGPFDADTREGTRLDPNSLGGDDPVKATKLHIINGFINNDKNTEGYYTVKKPFVYNNVQYKTGNLVRFI